VGSVRLDFLDLMTTFNNVLVIVQVAVVRRDLEEPAHVLGADHLLGGDEGLVEFLAVPGPDVLNAGLGAGELDDGLGQGLNGRGRSFLDEQVALLAVLEGEDHEVDRVVQGHHEAGHVTVRDRDGAAGLDLLEEERDDGAARGHDVAVAGQAKDGVPGEQLPRAGDDVLLHEGLRDAHRVDRIGRLVGREEDRLLDVVRNAGGNNIVRAEDVGLGRLERVELAGRDLLERRGGEAVVDPFECVANRGVVADVADVELQLAVVELLPHVVLLLLVAGQNANLFDFGL